MKFKVIAALVVTTLAFDYMFFQEIQNHKPKANSYSAEVVEKYLRK